MMTEFVVAGIVSFGAMALCAYVVRASTRMNILFANRLLAREIARVAKEDEDEAGRTLANVTSLDAVETPAARTDRVRSISTADGDARVAAQMRARAEADALMAGQGR